MEGHIDNRHRFTNRRIFTPRLSNQPGTNIQRVNRVSTRRIRQRPPRRLTTLTNSRCQHTNQYVTQMTINVARNSRTSTRQLLHSRSHTMTRQLTNQRFARTSRF